MEKTEMKNQVKEAYEIALKKWGLDDLKKGYQQFKGYAKIAGLKTSMITSLILKKGDKYGKPWESDKVLTMLAVIHFALLQND